MTDLPLIRLQPGRDRRVAAGHPWIFSNEIAMTPELRDVPLGAPVRVEAANGRALGVGGFNRHALIAVRMLDRNPAAEIGIDFLRRRLGSALALRDTLFDRPFYRLVHAEADGLPGLIVDRYGDVVVVQSNTALMDRLEEPLCDALEALIQPRAIVLRNDSAARGLEGLAEEVRVACGVAPGPIRVEENGAVFEADPLGGQKTGWFFDQRDNRAFVAGLARGRRMIDIYTHTGGFGIQAALAGAAAVTLVDRSAPSLELAAKAAEANGVAGRVATARGEAFAELERRGADGERWEVVVVDPPAFVKSKKDLAAGSRGYAKLARLAARITAPGGFLCAFSCSHHVDPVLFAEQVARGLIDAGRTGRILRQSGAGPDHPVHPLLPESAYLKGIILQLD